MLRRGEAPPGCYTVRVAADGTVSPAPYERAGTESAPQTGPAAGEVSEMSDAAGVVVYRDRHGTGGVGDDDRREPEL